jgi:hypothetical protein
MKKLFLAALVCCMTTLAFAEAGPICDGLLGKETGTGADVPARVKWTTDAGGNVDITILPYSKAEETTDKPTRWRSRGMADNLTADQGWEMTIDGKAAVLADFFEKNYTTPGNQPEDQAEAPSVYQLKIKDGKKAELAGKTVVIKKTTKGSNICWWTPRGNNGYGKATFEYLYGSKCEEVTLSAPTNVSIDNNVLTFDGVTGADSYAANIYLDAIMLKSIADIHSGDTLPRLMLTGATFQVKVVAKAGAVESEESVAADWVVANAQIEEIGTSEYCEEIIGKGTEQAGMTWQTDEKGDIHITISGEDATWRGTAFKGINNFWVGACPASVFFEEQYTQGDVIYTLHLKDADKAPIAGETISFKGTMQWLTATANNAYAENVTLAYTYTANCAGLDTPTNVAVNAEGVITFDPVVGATNYVVTIYKGIHPIAIYTNISSGDTLPFVAIETGTYNVTVYAQAAGALDSHESDPCDWQLTGTGWAPTKSTVCGVQYESDTYEENPYKVEDSYMEISVCTDTVGAIVITISPVIEGDTVTFRNNDALGLASFSTNGVSLAHYFTTNSKTLETRYVLNPKADRSLPYGSEISYKGTFQWATVGNPNSYKHNVSFTYIYGSVCEDQNDSTSINEIKQTVSAHKTIVNGHLYIISGERTYDAQGREIR